MRVLIQWLQPSGMKPLVDEAALTDVTAIREKTYGSTAIIEIDRPYGGKVFQHVTDLKVWV